MIISTTFSFPVFCLLFVGLPIATVGWSPLQTSRTSFRFDYTQHPYQSSTRKFHQCHKNRKFSSRSKLFVAADNSEETAMGLNELQTLFREAVTTERYTEAQRLKDVIIDQISSGSESKMNRLSWRKLGTAPWLMNRLVDLGYMFPTTIQINAFESVNAILGALKIDDPSSTPSTSSSFFSDEENETLEQLLEREGSPDLNMGVVISGSTGSGKTFAYLVPMLSILSESLYERQRLRVKSEEDIGDITGDLLARVAVQTSPTVRGYGRKQVGGGRPGGAIATGAALSSLGKSGPDVQKPVALIVVPTRELGVQIALLLYQLVGGSIKRAEGEISVANMFKYNGPKGVKVGCVLDDEEAKVGLKLQTDVAITTPKYLAKLCRDGDIIPSKLRVVAFDEADLALEQTKAEDLNTLFVDKESERDVSRLTYVVGATVTESLGKLCVKDSVLPDGKSFIATATSYNPLLSADTDNLGKVGKKQSGETASFQDLELCLDPGVRHERVVVQADTGLLCLARMLRKEVEDYEDSIEPEINDRIGTQSPQNRTLEIEDEPNEKNELSVTQNGSKKTQSPRVIVFFSGEDEARQAIGPLRDALWGKHKVCVLLPETGATPLEIMEQFKFGQTSLMIATPNSVRGLDFVNITHVYTMYLPSNDPREYLHLAGRVGRIGQMGSISGTGGRVTSILQPDQADQMDKLAKSLNFEFTDVESVSVEYDPDNLNEKSVNDFRRYLEDSIMLLNVTDDTDIGGRLNTFNNDEDNVSKNNDDDYDDDDDDDDDYDDDDNSGAVEGNN